MAKLALGFVPAAALASCGGKADLAREGAGSPASESPIAEPHAGSAPDATCALPGVVTLTQNVPQSATFTDAELECCVAHLEASVDHGGASPMLDSVSANCCNAAIAAVDIGMMEFSGVTSEVRIRCCFSGNEERQQDLWAHTLCSPWGPPVPPAIDWSVGGVA